ncbi:hypothetical protein D3C80_1498300 [compost metagenome]
MTSGAMRSISWHSRVNTSSSGSSFNNAPMTFSCSTSCNFERVMSVSTITMLSTLPWASNTGVDETCTHNRWPLRLRISALASLDCPSSTPSSAVCAEASARPSATKNIMGECPITSSRPYPSNCTSPSLT